MTLTKEDIAFLAEPVTPPTANATGFSGTVRDNEAFNHALQVNTPIGVDIWKGMNVVVERNKASDRASQVNAPMSEAAFLALLAARK